MIRGYEATLGAEWSPLSEQHKKHLHHLEEILSAYLKGNRDIPAVAVVGPYGQGKTQLLFHIFKRIIEGEGISVYTHADRIVKLINQKVGKNNKVLPSDLPKYLKETMLEEVKNIRNDQSEKNILLTDQQIIDYLKDRLPDNLRNKPMVLLIDELEQAYQLLQDKVETSDRNPIRSLLDPKEFYTVLAFAPRSIYEYELGATLGEGEAESSRLSIFPLPTLSPKELKKFLGIPSRGLANFVWWMSRGRARYAIKAFQESKKYAIEEPRGFRSFIESMGKISGVPCFDLDVLMDRKGNFETNWKDILNLVPSSTTDEEEWALLFKIDGNFASKSISFFGKLGFPGKYSMILSDYLTLLLRAISNEDEEAIIKKKDALPLVRATYELSLEHTYDEEFISVLQKALDELQIDLSLKYSLPDIMEEAAIAERTKLSKFLPFDFEKLLQFFPFPLSSPQLPRTSRNVVDKWLADLGDYPLAEDKEGLTSLLFFKDFEQFKRYHENRKHKFAEQALPEERLTTILLLRGEYSSMQLPAVAFWLKNQGRLNLERVRPSLLADFLCNALFLMDPDFNQPRVLLRKEIGNLREKFRESGDRATARKIYHYWSALDEFIRSVSKTLPGTSNSFTYERKGVAFERAYERQKSSEAFFYPFTLAFYAEDTEGLRALTQLRSWSERSDRPLNEYLPEEGGYRTAVSYLPTTDRKGVLRQSDSVRAIQSFFKDRVADLESLADSLSKEEFRMLVDDELSRFLLDSYYESKRFQAISEGEKKRVLEYLDQSLDLQRKILEEEEALKSSIGIGFEASLKFSSQQTQAISELRALLKGSDTWRSTIYQRVFFTFVEQIAIAIKNKADKFWKSLNQLPTYEYKKLKGLKELFSLPNQLPEDVFRYVGVSRDKFASELNKIQKDMEKKIHDYMGGLHGNNIVAIYNHFKDLMELQERLEDIRNNITSIKGETLQRYRKIKG